MSDEELKSLAGLIRTVSGRVRNRSKARRLIWAHRERTRGKPMGEEQLVIQIERVFRMFDQQLNPSLLARTSPLPPASREPTP